MGTLQKLDLEVHSRTPFFRVVLLSRFLLKTIISHSHLPMKCLISQFICILSLSLSSLQFLTTHNTVKHVSFHELTSKNYISILFYTASPFVVPIRYQF